MWDLLAEAVDSGQRCRIKHGQQCLSFREFFKLLETDGAFADWYIRELASCKFPAFYLEHPPLSSATFDQEAEFVLIDARLLAQVSAEPTPFESQFDRQQDKDIVAFPNLGGDALLIVPRPIGPLEAYPHLATFVRRAPRDQVRRLWQRTARAVRELLGPGPRWLSTAGLGVSWLHMRLDTRPKYYTHAPYRSVRYFDTGRG